MIKHYKVVYFILLGKVLFHLVLNIPANVPAFYYSQTALLLEADNEQDLLQMQLKILHSHCHLAVVEQEQQ